jgi:glycosyltransferase involved in cell wall biosynthesis
MISLVSTVYNDRDGLYTFFESMEKQARFPDEILIVDAGSNDGTWELMQTEASRKDRPWKMKALQESRCNVARGRNLAIEAASGDIIISTDIGCDWDREWLEELAAPFDGDSSIEQVNGSWAVKREDLHGPWAIAEWALKGDQRLEATAESHCSSRSIAYRKGTWTALGGYPEDLSLAGDDAVYDYLSVRAGVKRVGAPKIRCYWHRHESLKAFYKEAFRYGIGDGEAGIRANDVYLVGGRLLFEGVCLLLGLIGLWPCAPFSPWGGILLLCLTALSLLSKIFKMRAPASRLQREGVNYTFLRLLAFTYGIKWQWIRGHIAGRRRGRIHCLECRLRLKEMSPTLYKSNLASLAQ